MRDDEKEQYTKENDAGKRQSGDAAVATGGLSSRRSEVSSRLVCRATCGLEHKKTAPTEASAGQMHLLTENIHSVVEEIVKLSCEPLGQRP
jgi:hypothetical protein